MVCSGSCGETGDVGTAFARTTKGSSGVPGDAAAPAPDGADDFLQQLGSARPQQAAAGGRPGSEMFPGAAGDLASLPASAGAAAGRAQAGGSFRRVSPSKTGAIAVITPEDFASNFDKNGNPLAHCLIPAVVCRPRAAGSRGPAAARFGLPQRPAREGCSPFGEAALVPVADNFPGPGPDLLRLGAPSPVSHLELDPRRQETALFDFRDEIVIGDDADFDRGVLTSSPILQTANAGHDQRSSSAHENFANSPAGGGDRHDDSACAGDGPPSSAQPGTRQHHKTVAKWQSEYADIPADALETAFDFGDREDFGCGDTGLKLSSRFTESPTAARKDAGDTAPLFDMDADDSFEGLIESNFAGPSSNLRAASRSSSCESLALSSVLCPSNEEDREDDDDDDDDDDENFHEIIIPDDVRNLRLADRRTAGDPSSAASGAASSSQTSATDVADASFASDTASIGSSHLDSLLMGESSFTDAEISGLTGVHGWKPDQPERDVAKRPVGADAEEDDILTGLDVSEASFVHPKNPNVVSRPAGHRQQQQHASAAHNLYPFGSPHARPGGGLSFSSMAAAAAFSSPRGQALQFSTPSRIPRPLGAGSTGAAKQSKAAPAETKKPVALDPAKQAAEAQRQGAASDPDPKPPHGRPAAPPKPGPAPRAPFKAPAFGSSSPARVPLNPHPQKVQTPKRKADAIARSSLSQLRAGEGPPSPVLAALSPHHVSAAGRVILRRPVKSDAHQYGDGSELDGIDDIPVTSGRRSPAGASSSQDAEKADSGKDAGEFQQRKPKNGPPLAAKESAAAGRRPSSSLANPPCRSSNSSVNASFSGPDAAKESRSGKPARVPLQDRENRQAGAAASQPLKDGKLSRNSGGTSKQNQPPRKPTLIRNLNPTATKKVVGDMVYNPTLQRWEGNESVLKAFESRQQHSHHSHYHHHYLHSNHHWNKVPRWCPPGAGGSGIVGSSGGYGGSERATPHQASRRPPTSQPSPSSYAPRASKASPGYSSRTSSLRPPPQPASKARPALITQVGDPGAGANGVPQMVGTMVFDPQHMRWVNTEEADEEDVFAGLDDEAEPAAERGAGRAPSPAAATGSVARPGGERLPARRPANPGAGRAPPRRRTVTPRLSKWRDRPEDDESLDSRKPGGDREPDQAADARAPDAPGAAAHDERGSAGARADGGELESPPAAAGPRHAAPPHPAFAPGEEFLLSPGLAHALDAAEKAHRSDLCLFWPRGFGWFLTAAGAAGAAGAGAAPQEAAYALRRGATAAAAVSTANARRKSHQAKKRGSQYGVIPAGRAHLYDIRVVNGRSSRGTAAARESPPGLPFRRG